MKPKTFHVELLTPQKQVLACQAVSVVLPVADGMFGVLAKHAAFAAALGSGTLTITAPVGLSRYHVSMGAAHMRDNALVVLAENCRRAD